MSCPRCGVLCRCPSPDNPAPKMTMRKPRFQPEGELWEGAVVAKETVDPSPEESPSSVPRFVADSGEDDPQLAYEDPTCDVALRSTSEPQGALPSTDPDLSSWRDEVASRLNRYRAKRRPLKPRFPSLTLKFDAPEPSHLSSATRDSVVPDRRDETFPEAAPIVSPRLNEISRPETGRLIEFPRLSTLTNSGSELADPVTEIPRILEAPESSPPPPALGGILIEPPPCHAVEKRPGIEVPLQLASMSRRITASLVDGMIVLIALGMFCAIFYRITGVVLELREALTGAVPVLAIFWFGYQYLGLVLTGSTPGLRLAKLQLNRFDGTVPSAGKRRWRVLASVLSLASLGLGYAWSLIDEDQLCWHDRVTATHIAPKA